MHFLAPDAFEDDEGRRLKVDDRLLIKGQTNVYAIGDCCNTKVWSENIAILGALKIAQNITYFHYAICLIFAAISRKKN